MPAFTGVLKPKDKAAGLGVTTGPVGKLQKI
jgi:hypothetical protein